VPELWVLTHGKVPSQQSGFFKYHEINNLDIFIFHKIMIFLSEFILSSQIFICKDFDIEEHFCISLALQKLNCNH